MNKGPLFRGDDALFVKVVLHSSSNKANEVSCDEWSSLLSLLEINILPNGWRYPFLAVLANYGLPFARVFLGKVPEGPTPDTHSTWIIASGIPRKAPFFCNVLLFSYSCRKVLLSLPCQCHQAALKYKLAWHPVISRKLIWNGTFLVQSKVILYIFAPEDLLFPL